jgi:hypothetical protein
VEEQVSDTPRTDAALVDPYLLNGATGYVDGDFARQLERENQRLREALEKVAKEARRMDYDWDNRSSPSKALNTLERIARAALEGK